MNKRGDAGGIILFFVILFVLLIIGFMAAMIIGIIDFGSDTITPIIEDLGVIGPTNMSEVAGYTIGQVDVFIQALPWLVGFSYVAALIFSIIFAIGFSYNPHPVFIGFYFMLIILLIFGAIIMSNAYENIYLQENVLSDRLHEQTLMSYMILYAPVIYVAIAFLTGIYLFTRSSIGEGGI